MQRDAAKFLGVLAGVFLIPSLLLVAVFLVPPACADAEGARETLESNGYKNIETTGYRWLDGGDDAYVCGFRATSPAGVPVTGCVSHGFWKGSTIRFDR